MRVFIPVFQRVPYPGRTGNITAGQQEYEPATCAHCSGIGCLYCNKTGFVLVASPKQPCRYCDGVGCIYCGFTGWTCPKGKYD